MTGNELGLLILVIVNVAWWGTWFRTAVGR
jgi:hypothetical protein